MNKHNLALKNDGIGMEGYMLAECSCGWVGPKRGNYNNYQHPMMLDDFDRHVKQTNREEFERDMGLLEPVEQ